MLNVKSLAFSFFLKEIPGQPQILLSTYKTQTAATKIHLFMTFFWLSFSIKRKTNKDVSDKMKDKNNVTSIYPSVKEAYTFLILERQIDEDLIRRVKEEQHA